MQPPKPGVNALFLVALLFPVSVSAAMQPMNDAALSEVAGRDGLSVDISGQQVDAAGLTWVPDAGTAQEANFTFQDVRLSGVDAVGVPGGGYTLSQTLDAGSDGSNGVLGYSISLNNVRLAAQAMRLDRDTSNLSDTVPDPRSFGSFALDAGEARIDFSNVGLFNSAMSTASLRGEIKDGRLFYRQLWHDEPYLILNNLQALWNMQNATLGIITEGDPLDPYNMGGGLVHAADRIDVELRADWQYKDPGAGEDSFTITGNELPVFRFGWSGALKDATLIWRPDGSWAGDDWANASSGLTFSSRWNYINSEEAALAGEPASEFRWIFGESGGGVQIELGDWRPLGNNVYGHRFPLIGLDVISAGDGPGGLCFGGPNAGPLSAGAGCGGAGDQLLNLDAGHVAAFDRQTYAGGGTPLGGTPRTDATSLGLLLRDGNMLTASNKVKLRRNGTEIDQFDWGLIFTLANVDGNMYFYPGGNPSDDSLLGGSNNSLDNGFIIDLLLTSQSFDVNDSTTQGFNWDQGSHFMVADTAFETDGVGIGFLSSSVLLAGNDARFWIKPQTDPANFYQGGLDILVPQARWNFRSIFGGGSLPNGAEIVQGVYLDVNLEGMLNVRLSPADPAATVATGGGENYLGISMAVRLGDLTDPALGMDGGSLASGSGSYLSIAEPGRQDVKLTIGDIAGDIALTNGVIDLRGPDEEEAGSRPALLFSQDVLLGQSAAARMNDAVTAHTLPGPAAGQPLVINDVSFSGDSLGRMAIPSGQWGFSLKLKPQS